MIWGDKMNKNIIRKIIVTSFLITVLCSTTVIAEKPVFDIVICADTTRFNPGENLTFNLYFAGIGNVSEDYLLFYVDSDIYIEKMIHLGNDVTGGLNDQAKNAQVITPVIAGLESGEGYRGKKLYPTYAMHRDLNVPPLMVTLATRPNVSSGEHELKVIYLFKGDNNEWNEISEKFTFHITTEAEQIEFETLKLGLIEPYLATFGGLLSALFVYGLTLLITKRKEKKRTRELEKKLLLMIKDEIEFNLAKVKQIKDESRSNVIPNYRAKTDNKKACWSNIVEYRHEKPKLIEDISKLYFKYEFLNRTIDTDVQFVSGGIPIKDMFKEIKRICGEIKKSSDELIKKLEPILSNS